MLVLNTLMGNIIDMKYESISHQLHTWNMNVSANSIE